MKFHFRHHDHPIGGVIVPTMVDHPSSLLVIDAHGSSVGDFRSADDAGEYSDDSENSLDASLHHGECTRRGSKLSRSSSPSASAVHHHFTGGATRRDEQEDPTDNNHGPAASSRDGPTSKRALHLEHHESECPVANPDPASRPRSRQFFRLGRHRSKGIDKVAGAHKLSSRSKKVRDDVVAPAATAADAAADRLSSSEHIHSRALTKSASFDKLSRSECGPRTAAPHHRRHVTFSSVQIREYSTILGDHPCCPSGPPLSLGWELERENSMEFEVYEKERLPCRVRCREEMRLGGEERRGILQSLVVTATATSPSRRSDEQHHKDNNENVVVSSEEQCCVYSQRELRMAERRLTRERGCNTRMQRRMNRGFFRPLTPQECEIGSSGNGTVVIAMDESGGEEVVIGSPMKEESSSSSSMDISPAKPSATTTSTTTMVGDGE